MSDVARPTKKGLEYFPLDTDIDQDEKVVVVIAKHGMRGFGIIIRLMMEIYKNGYFYPWTEKEQYVFSMKIRESAEVVKEVVDECLKWGFFDEGMFEQHEILTSKGFQKRYLLATSRRKDIEIDPDHDLVNANNNQVNDDKNPNSDEVDDDNESAETPQKKRKENKRNNNSDIYKKIISYLNRKTGKKFSYKSAANQKLINGRMSEGRTVEDFLHVIDVKCEQWLNNPQMHEYLRPSTLFGQKNFENYVNEELKSNAIKQSDPRDKEIEFQQWIANGGDPDEFDWGK